MVKNSLHTVHIEQVAMNSMGVARVEGCVVFVKGALKGEECLIRILKVMKNYAFAKIEELITPSSHRAEPDCPHYPICGGCDLRHMDYEAELEAKLSWVSDALSRIGGSTVLPETIYGAGENAKLRNKAIYAVGHKDGRAVAGFYRSRSHDIIPAKRCLLQNEDCTKAVNCVTDWMDKYNIPSGMDGIRHIYVRSSFSRKETLVCPVSAKKKLPALDELVSELRKNVPSLSGVVLHVNSNPGNAVLAGKYFPLWGKGELTDSLLGLDFSISPAAFFQVNPPQTEKLYSLALDFAELDGNQSVLDLYCGIGTISLCLAKRAKEVIGVEEVAPAIENAIENAKRNGIENARFICCDADKVASQLKDIGFRPGIVVVDPPRKGLGEGARQLLCEIDPERIVYVSCDPATLARDIKALGEKGWLCTKAACVDMFPRTANVETVVLLSRGKADDHIRFSINTEDLRTNVGGYATYGDIKAYVLEKFGLKVSSLNIGQTKDKCGIKERENYNKGKEGHRVPNCTPEKEQAIMDAFRHFGMLRD